MANIPLSQLREMFDGMSAKTDWAVYGEMLWGYFFTDRDPKKLQDAAAQLSADDYRVVSIYETDDKSTYFLHVERIESHTPETLNVRNKELNQLAEELKIDTYDGMDVGPASIVKVTKPWWKFWSSSRG